MSENAVSGAPIRYGCLFCRVGSEESVVRTVKERLTSVDAVRLTKVRRRYTAGQVREETVSLLPGYVFVRAPEDYPLFYRAKLQGVHRVLSDTEGRWQLHGTDAEFTEKAFGTQGVIGLSQAWFEGDRIRISGGFLQGYEGNILRVNKRRGTAQVRLTLDQKEMLIWVGYELIQPKHEGSPLSG